MIIQFYVFRGAVCMFFWMVFLLTLCWCYSSSSLRTFLPLSLLFFGWKLYHNYMFNVLFLQTIIIHPEKYNLPLSRCEWISSEWVSEREEGRNFDGINVGRQLTSEYYIISQCTHINEAITRRWLGALALVLSSYSHFTNMICSCCCALALSSLLPSSSHISLWLLHCCSFGLYFVYASEVKWNKGVRR